MKEKGSRIKDQDIGKKDQAKFSLVNPCGFAALV
jgi:hypothetical protein